MIATESKTPTKSTRRGLTLIEVMLAVVILGIGSGVLLVAISRCMAVATRAKHYSHAQRLLLRIEAEHPISRNEIDEGTESGTFRDGYRWEREIVQSEAEGREEIYTIHTRVSWSARGTDSFESTTVYRYIPDKSFESTTEYHKSDAPRETTRRSRP